MFLQIPKTIWAMVFAYLGMFVLGISDNLRGPLFPELLTYFQLSNAQGSFSFALTSTAALLGNAGAAFILSKLYINKLLGWSVGCMAGGMLLMGVAPYFSIYLAGSVLFGFGMGATGVAQNLLIAENVGPAERPRALSTLHGLYGFSSLLAPLLASRSPVWVKSGWQSGFFVASVLSALVVVGILLVKPSSAFLHHENQNVDALKKSPVTLMLWFAGFFSTYVASEILVSSRLALYMRSYFGLSLAESSDYVTYFFVCLLFGRILFAVKTFSWPLRRQLNLSLFCSLLFLFAGLSLHPLFLVASGLSMAPFYPLAIVYISDQAGVQKRRFITFAMGMQSLCVILMHLGVGYLTDVFGLMFAFGVGIILLLTALICLNFHPEVKT